MVSWLIFRRSFPAMRGLAMMHHIVKWARSCATVMPFPTSSTARNNRAGQREGSPDRTLFAARTIHVIPAAGPGTRACVGV